MKESIKRIKEHLEKSTNPEEVYLYKTILESYGIQIRNLLTGTLSSEEEIELYNAINAKQKELRELKKSSNDKEEIDRITDLLATLEQYRLIRTSNETNIPNDQNHELDNNLKMELALGLSAVKNVVYQRSYYSEPYKFSYEPNYANITRLIEIDSDQELADELTTYYKEVYKLEDFKNYAAKRFRVQTAFDNLLPCSKLLSEYQDLIEEYFRKMDLYTKGYTERKEAKARLEALKEKTNPIKRYFAKRSIRVLESLIEQYNDQLKKLKEALDEDRRAVDTFIKKIDDFKLHRLFSFNRDILFTLGYIPSKDNPFSSNELDLTFEDLLNSDIPTDIEYFIGSNLHSINDENLNEITAYLEEIVIRLRIRIDELEQALDIRFRGLSEEAQLVLENEPEVAKTYVKLSSTVSRYGVPAMDYIYALDALNEINNMTISDIIEYIKESNETITYSHNPYTKAGRVISKKQN